jgi:hypothetical protein
LIAIRAICRNENQSGDKRLTIAGILCLVSLAILFLGPMFLLWAIPELPSLLALGMSSFGFGWGVLLIGSIALLLGGAVR